VALPKPSPGLVIGYAYLWRNEVLKGLEEGRKDRPCVVVLAAETVEGRTIVTVAPITHTPPAWASSAIEISAATKKRLGLDGQRSWIIASDLNRFVWPGVDLRPISRGSQTYHYGVLPAALYRELRDKVLELAGLGHAALSLRNE